MPRVASEDRKRAFQPKTQRRVKCGEERPACRRCTSTGRICDGYNELTSSTPIQTIERLNPFTKTVITQTCSIPSFDLFSCDQERQSFQFFLLKTAPQLAGDFECAFWERLLLQSAHHEPAIRHIIVALGSLHEHFEYDTGPRFASSALAVRNPFALRQYMRAMRCLMPSLDSSQPIDVCLISCLLFVCFEAMRGHYGSAIAHITSGLKILGELRTNTSRSFTGLSSWRTPYVPMNILCGLFTRLQAQTAVTNHKVSATRLNLWPEVAINLNQPVVFHSLADAREMLEIYAYYYRQRSAELEDLNIEAESLPESSATEFLNKITPPIVSLRDNSLSLLTRWSTALDDFLLERGNFLTDRERRGAAVLQLRHIDCFIMLDISQPTGGLEAGDHVKWDKYCPFFEQMVSLGESIVPCYPSSTSSLPSPLSPKTFSLDLNIIAAMFNVAARCRDPHIRRRAVRVLRTAAIQEGIWNSSLVATIAEKWIDIEEEGLIAVASYTDVPASARLSHFLPVFDVDQPSAIVYFSHSATMDSATVRRKLLQW
ncbi:hypothetical protein N7454_008497 [Penicillium verhagenii]|nr:hypothetical protein N7454_008497 [Penicillium verhagenii]